jgi:hypothetical protein
MNQISPGIISPGIMFLKSFHLNELMIQRALEAGGRCPTHLTFPESVDLILIEIVSDAFVSR